MKKFGFVIISIFLALNSIILPNPNIANANIVSKPLTITAKKVAKDLAKDSAVAMAEHIIFEKMMNDFVNGQHGNLKDGYAPVCLSGQKSVEDCPKEKTVQVKKSLNATDKSTLSSKVESVLERRTNTTGFNKFLDFFVPIFLVSGLIAVISSELDGDSENFIDEVAMQALIDAGLMQSLNVSSGNDVPLYDFKEYIQSITVSEGEYSGGLSRLKVQAIVKPGAEIKGDLTDRNGNLVSISASGALTMQLGFGQGSYVVTPGKDEYIAWMNLINVQINNGTIQGYPFLELHRGSTIHSTRPPAENESYQTWKAIYLSPFLSKTDINDIMNSFIQLTNRLGANLNFQVSLQTPMPTETQYEPQTGLQKIKNPDGTVNMKGMDSFTYTYNNTYVYPSTDSDTGWKDKTTGEDTTVVEDDIVANEVGTDVPPDDSDDKDCGLNKELELEINSEPDAPESTEPEGNNEEELDKDTDEGSCEDNPLENLSRAQKRNLETLDNIVSDHLTEEDFSGTLLDLQGNPVTKPGGGYWNHLQEMKDSYKGLKKIKNGLEGSLKNPKLNEAERKILQDALDKVNRYIKKIEDLFSGYGGIAKMSINNTIGSIYNLPTPYSNFESNLDLWYKEFYNKQIEDISTLDVIRMLQQNILEDLAIRKAIESIHENPLAGAMYDGQLMEVLLSLEFNKLNDSIEEVKNLVSEVSLRVNELDWLTTEDMEEYYDLLRAFQEKISNIK